MALEVVTQMSSSRRTGRHRRARPPARLGRLIRSRAVGAVAAQTWQAVGSFGLQFLASRLLGAQGLGIYALCYGIIVAATAFTSGLIGDSLTVLDRHKPSVRSGLQVLSVVAYIVGATGSAVVLCLTHQLDLIGAGFFLLAMISFQFEETIRRLFMARLQFWIIVFVDGSGMLVAFFVLWVGHLWAKLDVNWFLSALLVGQVISSVTGLVLLPRQERLIARFDASGIREVLGFGGWRGIQVTIPAMIQSIARSLVVAAAGAPALGALEAARLCVAPLQITINGLGSYFLSSFVHTRSLGRAWQVRRARISAWLLTGATLVGGAVVGVAALHWQHLLTAGRYELGALAVAAWVVYTARTAALMSWFSLAASVANQRTVTLLRLLDASVAIVLSWVLLFPASLSPAWVPLALATGQLVGTIPLRWLVVKKAKEEARLQAVAGLG